MLLYTDWFTQHTHGNLNINLLIIHVPKLGFLKTFSILISIKYHISRS